jgi:xanthine dehydrogenase accessory factor
MYELIPDITPWIEQKKPVCLATVISTWGSSIRQAGGKMAFTPDNQITGSVSGGCVEGAVIEAGIHSLETNRPELLHYGVADETAFSVGLTCGGKIDVLVRKLDEALFRELTVVVQSHIPAALLTVIDPSSNLFGNEMLVSEERVIFGSLGKDLDEQAVTLTPTEIAKLQSHSIVLELPGKTPIQVFVDVISPPPVLVIVGGVHIAVILADLAKTLGFHTIVIDPRKAFGSSERFPQVDQLIQEWPEEALQKIPLNSNTSVTVLTHDPKIDDPAMKVVVRSPVKYIGVLSSRKTHEKRKMRLLAEGITTQQFDQIRAPIGIDLGGKSPQEIALGILAEIVAVRNGKIIQE